MNELIDANISHSFFLPAPGGDFSRAIAAALPGAVHYDASGDYEQDYIRDLQTAERFLHGGGQTYRVERFFPDALRPDLARAGLSAWCVMLSWFPEVSLFSLSFHRSVRDASLDSLILLRQCGDSRPLPFPEGERSCAELAEELCRRLGAEFTPLERGFLCEITRFGDWGDAEALGRERVSELYGILSGDEGYAFVPRAMAEERLRWQWGSRDFIRIFAFGQAFLFLNLLSCGERERYLRRQQEFGQAAYGGCDAYFTMGSCPLSANHGILFSVEFVLMLKGLIDGVLARQGDFSRPGGSFYRRIRDTREFRRKIIMVLERVESIEISEIGELSSVLMDSQHISPIVDQVKYLLELLDSDLNLMYSARSNALVTFLTVLGLVLAALQVLLAVV